MGGYGNYGYSWSSTVGDINGLYLGFLATGLFSTYANSRAYSFQLRCLSE